MPGDGEGSVVDLSKLILLFYPRSFVLMWDLFQCPSYLWVCLLVLPAFRRHHAVAANAIVPMTATAATGSANEMRSLLFL